MMKKVLVVDDNREIARFLTKLLKQEGYEVSTFFDSEKALKELLSNDYDCVVSDGEMPFMSGPRLMQMALHGKPSMKGRFVFQTGSPFAIMSAIQSVGTAKVLYKPVHRSDLLDAVEQAIKTCGETSG